MSKEYKHEGIMEHLSAIAEGREVPSVLEFDTQTGRLRIANKKIHCDLVVKTDIASRGFFGGSFTASIGNDSIYIPHIKEQRIDVKTMHISCKSDTYQLGYDYGGVIIYQYDGKSEWRTTNNTRCKSGYIVIQDTDSENVKQWRNEPGIVHGAIYRNVFGESVNDAHVVGEGFAVRNGKSKIEINSSVFNTPEGSIYYDGRRRMHELTEHCVGKIVEYWKAAGPCWVRQQNFEVKQLLEDFDVESV